MYELFQVKDEILTDSNESFVLLIEQKHVLVHSI